MLRRINFSWQPANIAKEAKIMAGFDRLGPELWELVNPRLPENRITFIVWIILIVLAFAMRKEFGGFFRTFFKIIWVGIILMVLNAISPYLMWGFIAIGVLAFFFGNKLDYVKYIILGIVVVGAIALAFRNAFLV